MYTIQPSFFASAWQGRPIGRSETSCLVQQSSKRCKCLDVVRDSHSLNGVGNAECGTRGISETRLSYPRIPHSDDLERSILARISGFRWNKRRTVIDISIAPSPSTCLWSRVCSLFHGCTCHNSNRSPPYFV